MPHFTLQLKTAIELTGGVAEVDQETGIRKLVGGNIGLGYYPIFDEQYRDRLTSLIVDHFWNREIGRETIDDFQRGMRHRMNLIMPNYNLLYESTRMTYDPLKTIDIVNMSTGKAQIDREGSSTSNGTSTTNALSNTRNIGSSFPQTQLSGDEDYADTGMDSNASTSSAAQNNNAASESGAESSEQEGESRTSGYQGSPADLIMRYREAIINVDAMILLDLDDLFMQVMNNNDEYYPNHFAGWIY